MRRLLSVAGCAGVVGFVALLAPVAADAATHQCTSSPAIEVIESHHDIPLSTACRVVGKFETWLRKDNDEAKLNRCSSNGASTLLLHSFDGYKLRQGDRFGGGLEFSRGRSSFLVSGYSGWPTGCGL
jgi:hypothetical protein